MKKMILVATLLVNMVVAVFGTDFEERITEKKWYRDYFNEVTRLFIGKTGTS